MNVIGGQSVHNRGFALARFDFQMNHRKTFLSLFPGGVQYWLGTFTLANFELGHQIDEMP